MSVAMMDASSSSAPSSSMATASGYLALLQEDSVQLKGHALEQLLLTVDTLWHEMADSLTDLEAAVDDITLPVTLQQTAAALCSRVFFYLSEPEQALRLALLAGPQHFDPMDTSSAYTQRLVAAALDAYLQHKKQDAAATEKPVLPLEDLSAMVHRLLDASCEAGHFEHAFGLALEAQEVPQVEAILTRAGPTLLPYALESVLKVVEKSFRLQALQVVAKALEAHYANAADAEKPRVATDLVRVHQVLQEPLKVVGVLQTLLQGSELEAALALQLAFDLMDTGDRAFCAAVAGGLTVPEDAAATATRWEPVTRVLDGGFLAELSLSFLHKHSQADRLQMELLKKALEERAAGNRSSVLHTAAVVTHAYLYAGTTNDSFLRDYLDWMKKASNWAKFSATASLGVVHASHITEAMHLLQPYLPTTPADGEPGNVSPAGGYSEGGALYALGLIHGSHAGSSTAQRKETTEFLRKHLRASHANEVISHGAALGVGLTAMGTADLTICQELKELLDTDSAVAGEAAGLAAGMVLVGTGATNLHNNLPTQNREEIMELVAELKNYARETHHEKIIRGISMGLALMNYGQEEHADATIEEMRSDRDPVLRYGAMYSMALAYCGTGSNKAIRILLHTAVSDVSDDVRMAAVLGLAFVLFQTPERVPQLVRLLLESFNPHVRYASCMAVGIAMAGTGDSESVSLLEPMLEDMTDYVRQGALMGTAMIYMQQSDTANSRRIRSFRERLSTVLSEKHQSMLTKMGAILATGIQDSGGRNVALQLGSSRHSLPKMSSAVGLALWLQHWHWYPCLHFWSLSVTPTYTVGLNAALQYPKNFTTVCHSKPSVFAYPKKLEEKKEEKKKRVETVTLSTTAKEKARLARKRAKLGETMDVDEEEEEEKEEEKEEVVKKKKREPEPTSFVVANPARMTLAQAKVTKFDWEQRYRPVRPDTTPYGVVLLQDSTPSLKDDLGAIQVPSMEPPGELAPPAPFTWSPPVMDSETAPAAEAPAAGAAAEGESKDDNDDEGGTQDMAL